MSKWSLFHVLIFLVFLAGNTHKSYAHDLGVVRMELIEKSDFTYILIVKLPIQTEIETPHPILPEGFEFINKPGTFFKNTFSVTRYEFKHTNRNLNSEDILILPWILDSAFVHANWLDNSLRTILIKEGKDGIHIPINALKTSSQSSYQEFKDFLILGIEHILLGWDHLAFVLALCLIARGRHLIKLITAFTIGHSITLVLAVLGIVHIPIPPVEACIAISIALVANEFFKTKNRALTSSWVVIAFGLLHGLGFASVLSEIGIEKTNLVIGLVSFNLGVEIGQLLFVLLALGIFYFIKKTIPIQYVRVQKVVVFSLGVLGFFWFFERVSMF